MASTSSFPLPFKLGGVRGSYGYNGRYKELMVKNNLYSSGTSLSSYSSRLDAWSLLLLSNVGKPLCPVQTRSDALVCRSLLKPVGGNEIPIIKKATAIWLRSHSVFHGSPIVLQLVPAVGVIAFAAWGIGPLMRLARTLILHRNDNSWKNSGTHHVTMSYLQPLLLWTGSLLVCRSLDPVVLPSVASQAVKQRLLIFVRSLSTVLAFAYCLSGLIHQTQKFLVETKDPSDARNMGFEFAGKSVYTAVWVAAVSLFMELLGFSTQKWLTAGGLGTVLLTLAGREIFTNFLSSIMIHATRPFVPNDWVQTKIEGYEVSGTVEHVGWWSPTVIRGEDREAVHIPNHKFTVNVVRNLTQKTHWRIKTHLAISHLDVSKINNIVADMRKVLAKNPQVEQQRLHRRVFLDNIHAENQALMIMISCFVKTSRFEEYLCVKEAILLDLLRVISHHRARLATPIRTVQKIYSEASVEDVPFSETIFSRTRGVSNRPFLLVEPSYKINGEEKPKASTRSVKTNEEKDLKVPVTSDSKMDTESGTSSNLDEHKTDTKISSKSSSDANSKSKTGPMRTSDVKTSTVGSNNPTQGKTDKKQLNNVAGESVASASGLNSEGASSLKSAEVQKTETPGTSPSMQDGDRPTPLPAVTRPTIEDNIVLGVALEGSKRTLPIEEEMPMPPTHSESKELAACRNGNGSTSSSKDKDDPVAGIPPATPGDQLEKER